MHASFKVGDTEIMASDGDCGEAHELQAASRSSLSVKDDAEAKRRFDALADGGKVDAAARSRRSSRSSFGMLTDQFGVGWMVIVPQA